MGTAGFRILSARGHSRLPYWWGQSVQVRLAFGLSESWVRGLTLPRAFSLDGCNASLVSLLVLPAGLVARQSVMWACLYIA